jgi:hypothetical protein
MSIDRDEGAESSGPSKDKEREMSRIAVAILSVFLLGCASQPYRCRLCAVRLNPGWTQKLNRSAVAGRSLVLGAAPDEVVTQIDNAATKGFGRGCHSD